MGTADLVEGTLSLRGNIVSISRSFGGIVHVEVVLASIVNSFTSLLKFFQLLLSIHLLSRGSVHDQLLSIRVGRHF